jgi:hypothetical protein
MSKRMNRVALAVLISVAVLAVLYTSVLGASLNAGASRGGLRVDAGLVVDRSHERSQAISLNEYYSDLEGSEDGHDCGGGGSSFDD